LFFPVLSAIELAAGLVVISGLFWRELRYIVLLLFISFAAYAFNQAVAGADTCGCFGPVRIHPWWTFLLDMAIVLGLLVSICRSFRCSDNKYVWCSIYLVRSQLLFPVIVSCSIASAVLIVRYLDRQTAFADSFLSTASDITVLDPDQWIGERLRIAESVNLDLSKGKWIVLLHRYGCPECEAAIPKYGAIARQLVATNLAFVEIPPYGNGPAPRNGAVGRLTDERQWFVKTPLELQLEDGVVKVASHELPTIHASARDAFVPE
jgi:hypothetical protein